VGGTINEDDHVFGLSAARRYGGLYVPPHLAVIHSYMREEWAGCGKMILGSDSHTRYGALGTLAVGEGGGELVKQLLSQTYDLACPRIIAVYLEGKPRHGVGPMDAALALVGAVFKDGFAKNAVLEFTGPGVASLTADFRSGLDVMTTETACWSSIWETDGVIRDYLELHGRPGDYRELKPASPAYYDGLIRMDLAKLKPMIALPFHPSNVYELDELRANAGDIFRQIEKDAPSGADLGLMKKIGQKGAVHIDQGIIAGCAGGSFGNISAAAAILGSPGDPGASTDGADFSLSVYPGSQPVFLELAKNGVLAALVAAGAVVKTAFCGPCFGAGDVPCHQGLSIRHTTRNFPHREGSKPGAGQIASVALMDARSIAATARSGGVLSSAEYCPFDEAPAGACHYDRAPYAKRVYNGIGRPDASAELRYGPNIGDWPDMDALGENLLLKIVSFITDPVTTTDELIPSGETSSYRSNPRALAEFTLSRKDPAYVGRAKEAAAAAALLKNGGRAAVESAAAGKGPSGKNQPGKGPAERGPAAELAAVLRALDEIFPAGAFPEGGGEIQFASALFAVKPGDGSAREQAASCQRVLGGGANFANEYATKRYRSNLINWGLIPFIVEGEPPFQNGDYLFIPGVRDLIRGARNSVRAEILRIDGGARKALLIGGFTLAAPDLDDRERELLLAGSLINYNRSRYSLAKASSMR
jgi:aconitate hydratase